MNPSLLDTTRPIDSIVQFTNRHLVLPKEKKQEFLQDLQDFISSCSYEDKTTSFEKKFRERFSHYDLPNLYEVMEEIKCAVKKGKFLHITANLSKIAQQCFLPRDVPQCYQLRVTESDIWGWIPKEYVEGSEELKKYLNSSTNTLDFKELSPSIVFGIQRIQFIKESSTEIDLSLDVFLELVSIFLNYEINSYDG